MIRSPPNTLQRSQFYSRHTNNDPLHTHSSTQKPTQRSPITTPSLECTPKHMLYRVPKSIIKTGGSTRNVDSVIKPREFGKYLEAFRRPGSSTNTATITITATPATATATATATSTVSRDTTNHLLTPLPTHPLPHPHPHPPLTTAPSTPCVPDPAILATKIVETSSVKARPQVGKPPLNRNASTDSVVTTIENRENICNDAIEIDNPFQPRQKAMRRTPPKTVTATPQKCHTVEVPKVLITEETTESIMTKSTVIVQKCPDGDVTESKSEVQVLCSDDQVENEVLQALAPLPPLPPTRRVTTGRVMHSPPSVIQNSPSRMESSKMNVSPMGSSMYRLLSNGYAPADDTPVAGCLPTKEAVRSPCMESTRNSTPANEVVSEQEITDVQKCQEVDIHAEKAVDIEPTTTVDPVQQYAEKLSKQFADNNSPQCMTGFEQQEVSSFPICSPLPVVEVPVQINEAEFVSVSTSMSFIDNNNLGSKSQTSDVDISMSDRLLEEKEVLQQTFDNKMETITSAHFYKEKELRMDLLLQRYYGNYVLQDVLDVKKELRDEKTQRIETEIQVWEANRLLYQSSTTKSQSSTTTTLASSPSVVVENCYNDIVDTKSMNESPITQHLSLDFSSIPADQDEDVSDLSLSCIQELNKSMKSELFMDSMTSTSHSVMEEDQNDAVTTQEIYDNNSGGCELTTEDSTSTCDSVDDDVAVSHGMRFIPLRSSKLCRAVGHVAKPSKISTTPLNVMKKAPTQTKKRAQGDVIQESLSATTEINVEEQEDHKPKRTCQKKTPIKPTKRRASRKEENEVSAIELAVVDDVDKSQEGEAQEISISESKKSAATSKAKTKSTAKTGGNTKAKPNTKPKAKPKAKSKACTVFNDVIENDEPESMKEDEDAKEKNIKLSKATKKKTVKKVDKKADHETSVVNDICSENKEAYGKFCDFTRPGVEDILSKESKVGTKSKSKKIIDPSKVDDMLSQMWNIQTDSERARWAHNDVELLEKASIDLEVEVVKDVPKRAKSTKKKKDVTTKETQLTPVLELPENTATTTSVDSISRVAVMEEEVLTPVQLPTKAMSKRQKRSKLIDEEIEKQDNIQEFAPKRKIVKKMNAPEVNHTKKASLFPNQGISYPKILPLKSKMNAIIPKLKSRK